MNIKILSFIFFILLYPFFSGQNINKKSIKQDKITLNPSKDKQLPSKDKQLPSKDKQLPSKDKQLPSKDKQLNPNIKNKTLYLNNSNWYKNIMKLTYKNVIKNFQNIIYMDNEEQWNFFVLQKSLEQKNFFYQINSLIFGMPYMAMCIFQNNLLKDFICIINNSYNNISFLSLNNWHKIPNTQKDNNFLEIYKPNKLITFIEFVNKFHKPYMAYFNRASQQEKYFFIFPKDKSDIIKTKKYGYTSYRINDGILCIVTVENNNILEIHKYPLDLYKNTFQKTNYKQGDVFVNNNNLSLITIPYGTGKMYVVAYRKPHNLDQCDFFFNLFYCDSNNKIIGIFTLDKCCSKHISKIFK